MEGLGRSSEEKVSGETIASDAGEVSGMIRMKYNPHTYRLGGCKKFWTKIITEGRESRGGRQWSQ